MRLTLVRHAESESNVAGRWQGQGDSVLSPEGRRQAEALGKRLRDAPYDLVIASDLTRTADTARALGRAVETDPAWREIDVGRWEGLTRGEVAQRFPDEVERLLVGDRTVKIGGAESWSDLHARVDEAFRRLRARVGDGHALVVSHGGVITSLLAGLLGVRERRPYPIGRVSNTAVTRIEVTDAGVRLEGYNDTAHVAPVGTWAGERLDKGEAVLTLIAADGEGTHAGPLERFGRWYPAFTHLYAGAERAPRDVAAALASHHGLTPAEEAIDTEPLDASLTRVAERHRGARVGLVLGTTSIATWAAELLGGATRVCGPHHTAIAHVVVTPHGQTLADYNVRCHGG